MTSPSSDALSLNSAYRNAIDAARSDKTIGAGQRATAVHGLEILQFEERLGIALYPAEPISHVIAALGSDYQFFTWLLGHWQQENHPHADARIDAIGQERATVLDYLTELLPHEVPGIYTHAKTPEDLEILLSAPPPQAAGRIDYQALKDQIDIVEYISRYVTLRRAGTRYTGKCPFHAEHTASFTVYPNTRSYYCFGCMAGGDVINFAKAAHNSLPLIA